MFDLRAALLSFLSLYGLGPKAQHHRRRQAPVIIGHTVRRMG
jgi:hypothetical protein